MEVFGASRDEPELVRMESEASHYIDTYGGQLTLDFQASTPEERLRQIVGGIKGIKGIRRLSKAYSADKIRKENINQRGYNKVLDIAKTVSTVTIDVGLNQTMSKTLLLTDEQRILEPLLPPT